jgi:hypothetical protein
MKRMPVKSASLASVGYDRELNTLGVQSRNGLSYQYFAVPERVFERLMAATSKGIYLNEHIKVDSPSAESIINQHSSVNIHEP